MLRTFASLRLFLRSKLLPTIWQRICYKSLQWPASNKLLIRLPIRTRHLRWIFRIELHWLIRWIPNRALKFWRCQSIRVWDCCLCRLSISKTNTLTSTNTPARKILVLPHPTSRWPKSSIGCTPWVSNCNPRSTSLEAMISARMTKSKCWEFRNSVLVPQRSHSSCSGMIPTPMPCAIILKRTSRI